MATRGFYLLAVLLAGCSTSTNDAESFEYRDAHESIVLDLKKNGGVEYIQRVEQPNGTSQTFEADTGAWERCPSAVKSATDPKPDGYCITVTISGKDEQGSADVSFQFIRYPDRLVEYTESGPGRSLNKRSLPSQ
jgi:hypothetical protein